MCSKPIFCSKIALKGKTCSRFLKPQKVAPNAKSCSKVAEHNRDRPSSGYALFPVRFLGNFLQPSLTEKIGIEILVVRRNLGLVYFAELRWKHQPGLYSLLTLSCFKLSVTSFVCVFIFSRVAHPDPKNPNSIPTFGYRNVLPLNKNASDFQVSNEPTFLRNSGLVPRVFSRILYFNFPE